MHIVWLGVSAMASDMKDPPPNSWVEVKPKTAQPAAADEKGQWINAGWNKLVYDPESKRILFYDRWYDKKHGGDSIYGNCLYAFEPATETLTPVKIANWTLTRTNTVPLPEDEKEPTPCDRHVYRDFE